MVRWMASTHISLSSSLAAWSSTARFFVCKANTNAFLFSKPSVSILTISLRKIRPRGSSFSPRSGISDYKEETVQSRRKSRRLGAEVFPLRCRTLKNKRPRRIRRSQLSTGNPQSLSSILALPGWVVKPFFQKKPGVWKFHKLWAKILFRRKPIRVMQIPNNLFIINKLLI